MLAIKVACVLPHQAQLKGVAYNFVFPQHVWKCATEKHAKTLDKNSLMVPLLVSASPECWVNG